MSWEARIERWDEDDAEIRVEVTFGDDYVDIPLHRESFTVAAGTPEDRILEKIGEIGRSARYSFARRVESGMVGKTFPIDDL